MKGASAGSGVDAYDGVVMVQRVGGAAGGTNADGSRLAGRRAIVTGAARGIGAQIARTFAGAGARVALLDISPDVKAVAAEFGGPAQVADLADPEATRDALGRLIAALGGVDVLVNNAGILRITPLLDITVDEWDLVLAVNARSMLVTTQVAARSMIAAGTGGRIVNMASMGAKRAAADQAHYAASKAAVVAITQAAAIELGPHGITVNAICPGYVLTEMGAATRTPEMVAAWSASSPLGRCAEPADVAGMALFLASDDAAYCTGQAFNVTGGMIMH
jgi:NAD(P)-dependent dehydrogenase (short-subunit alcohol dehydrogenase family)